MSSRQRPGPASALVLLDPQDDIRVLRALEDQVMARQAALIARPVPGAHGIRWFCEALLADIGPSPRAASMARGLAVEEQTVEILRRRRVKELFVTRAHTLNAWSWADIGHLAARASVALRMVVHEPVVGMEKLECLTRAGLRVERVPRLLMVTEDTLSLSLGMSPTDSTPTLAGAPVWWLPAVKIPWLSPVPVS